MNASLFSVRRFLIIFSIAWLVLMINHALILQWFGLSWEAAVVDSLISNSFLFLICLLLLNTFRYYAPAMGQYLSVLGMCLLFSVVWVFATRWLLDLVLSHYENYSIFLHRSLIIRFSIAFLILGIVTMMAIIWFNWQDQQKNETRKSDAEKLAKEAELFKLRQQLQPHFLFNSLNSINALIAASPQEARKMVQQLSDFLRGSIRKEDNQFITFAEELEYLQLYLEIEKVRFGYRLKTDTVVSEEALTWKMPSLLLQTLMENAIKFGLYGTRGEVLISLHAAVDNNHLVVRIENPFDPDMQMPKGTGFGLKSVRRRLYLLFGRNDLMEINQTENAFVVIFKIPATNEAG
ncbi:MAG: histidine kinase [Chitinophagaceae bacterium]